MGGQQWGTKPGMSDPKESQASQALFTTIERREYSRCWATAFWGKIFCLLLTSMENKVLVQAQVRMHKP